MSSYLMEFAHRYSYAFDEEITLPITLYSDLFLPAELFAKLDTGSTFCVFERKYAEVLRLDLESGHPQRIRTATGNFYADGHEVTLCFLSFEWQTMVYFAEAEAFDLNVVGRIGFLDQLRIALIDYDQILYASRYEEQ